MRGTKSITHGSSTDPRITPACAGNRRSLISLTTRIWDHPRVCGEQKIFNSCIAIIPDHPRVCGEQMPPVYTASCSPGSPPRVRGTVCDMAAPPVRFRITPACAGNRVAPGPLACGGADHPRVCGEQLLSRKHGEVGIGSPPRVRGTVGYYTLMYDYGRITPACAGNST